jgi:hypothetical protein
MRVGEEGVDVVLSIGVHQPVQAVGPVERSVRYVVSAGQVNSRMVQMHVVHHVSNFCTERSAAKSVRC